MNEKRQIEQGGGLTVGDVYFTIFRHKWKIILCSLAGILAAAWVYYFTPMVYQSEAKLYIQSVFDSRSVNPGNKVTVLDDQAENVMNTEVEIITSLDLAKQVAQTIGPAKILGKGEKDVDLAAAVVRGGLSVQPLRKSSILVITFQHPNSSIVSPVLAKIISDYLDIHDTLHRKAGAFNDYLREQTRLLKNKIGDTEQQLRQIKDTNGIISLDETAKADAQRISKVHEDLFVAQTELAQRQEFFTRMTNLYSLKPATSVQATIPGKALNEYKNLSALLTALWNREQELIFQGHKDGSKLLKENRARITETEKLKTDLEEKYPRLLDGEVGGRGAVFDLSTEVKRIWELQIKTNVLAGKLAEIRADVTNINQIETTIAEIQRQQRIDQENYNYFSTRLEQSKFDSDLRPEMLSNIKTAQLPTPPFLVRSKTFKLMGKMIGGGIFAGLGLAFLVELLLDRSVKRPVEIATKLKLPLFLSIPQTAKNGSRRLLKRKKRRLQLADSAPGVITVSGNGASEKTGELEITTWNSNHALRSYYEALRDRLILYFEVKNVTRKPKLVAVTSANKGSGVTTIAMGLAASLSETGDGNVLLVDMNVERGAAHPFHQGKPTCQLDDALESEKRDSALVQDNLYVVTEKVNGDKLSRILPKRFSALLPKLKASDYDYIIFDLPPITQTSVTPRIAGFMDMVLLVIESEKTDREVAQRANELLAESKANVVAVLNKTRKYVPARLHREFLNNA